MDLLGSSRCSAPLLLTPSPPRSGRVAAKGGEHELGGGLDPATTHSGASPRHCVVVAAAGVQQQSHGAAGSTGARVRGHRGWTLNFRVSDMEMVHFRC